MTAATAALAASDGYHEAIAHLPEGGTLMFQFVSWDRYEKLLEELGHRYRARVSYDHGRLEINMPLPVHDKYKDFTSRLMQVLTEELELDMEGLGSTTFKHESWLQGVEPDTCFYLKNLERVIGIERFDPNEPPPPPDIAVEIDITSESLGRFPIYANLGVPEIWRYDGHQVWMYHLTEAGYVEAPASRAFPLLTATALGQFLERSQTEGQSAVLREFRQWVRALQAPAS